jgi:hypothetical protein
MNRRFGCVPRTWLRPSLREVTFSFGKLRVTLAFAAIPPVGRFYLEARVPLRRLFQEKMRER